MAIQWHPAVHEKWAHESLYFWRLGFSPTYRRENVRDALGGFLQEAGVLSFVGYELLGIHDVMLRVWLPASLTPSEFNNGLYASLKPHNLQMSDYFAVSKIFAHWLWRDERGGIAEPDSDILDGGLPEDRDLSSLGEASPHFKQLQPKGLVKSLNGSEGAKFFTVITATENMSVDARDDFHHEMSQTLHSSGVSEPSLYVGHGFGAGSMIMMGRVPFQQFYDLGEKLALPITRFTSILGVRPYTFPTSTDGFFLYSEHLPKVEVREEPAPADVHVAEPEPVPSVAETLLQGESGSAEVKASAFLNLDRLTKGDRRATFSNEIAQTGFLRAMVALLNGEGGRVIIGAAEAKHYSQDELVREFGELTRRGAFWVLGIDMEIEETSRDDFELKLHNTISTHVTPDPSGAYKVLFERLDGRTMLVIAVAEGRQWYYLDNDEFHVRTGNRSRLLKGTEADRYKDHNPRS